VFGANLSNYLGASIMTFYFPDALFIVVAVLLFLIFRRPHQVVGLRYLATSQVAAVKTLDVDPNRIPRQTVHPSAAAPSAPDAASGAAGAAAVSEPAKPAAAPADSTEEPGDAASPTSEDTK
jgi:hypothetical protein